MHPRNSATRTPYTILKSGKGMKTAITCTIVMLHLGGGILHDLQSMTSALHYSSRTKAVFFI